MLGYQASTWGLLASGVLIFVFIVMVLYYAFGKKYRFDPYQVLVLILLAAVAVGIHSLQHEGQEVNYNIRF